MSKLPGLTATALGVLAGCADTRTCSIQVPITTSRTEYPQLAQISRAVAEQSARDRLHAGQAGRIVAANLESDAGCLIWAVEMSLPGEGRQPVVRVDAGDGRVLMVKQKKDTWFDE
jgi:uncharacterized membrane protein YkoI